MFIEILMEKLGIKNVPLYDIDQNLDADLRVLKSSDMEEFYKTPDPWVNKKDNYDNTIVRRIRCQFIKDTVADCQINSIIDIGGGEGIMLNDLKHVFLPATPKAISIDISPTACKRAKELGITALSIDIEKEKPMYQYDIVLVIGVLYYLGDWHKGAQYCFDSVADNGFLFVSDTMIRYYQRESFGRKYGMKEIDRVHIPVMKIVKKNGKIEIRTEKLIAYKRV